MERLPNRYPKISQSHKVPLYKGLSLFYPKLLKNFVTVGNSLIISSWRSINSIYSTAHILNRLSTPITFYAERNY